MQEEVKWLKDSLGDILPSDIFHWVLGQTQQAVYSLAIQVMEEVRIDINKQKPKMLTKDMIKESVVRINMGCIEKQSCPSLFIHDVMEWNIEDHKRKSIELQDFKDIQ